MSDAVANYENTKRNTPVPPGWMLVEPEGLNPADNPTKFWNPLDQCWLDLTITAQGAPDLFNKLWAGGATCLVVKDPNYVAPPPPPAFGGMPGLPFAVPAPMTPVAPAPIPAPMAAPIPVLAPASVPVLAPVVPTPVPVAPANILPFVTSSSAPVLPVPSIPMPVPAPVEAYDPRQDYENQGSDAPVSSADPNEVSAWLAARDGVLAQLDALEKVENELRKRIVKVCFPDGLREGANKCVLPDGGELVVTGVINRTVDEAQVATSLSNLQVKNGVAPTGLFKTEHTLDLRVFKALPAEDKALLADCVTEKEGSPQLKVRAAK